MYSGSIVAIVITVVAFKRGEGRGRRDAEECLRASASARPAAAGGAAAAATPAPPPEVPAAPASPPTPPAPPADDADAAPESTEARLSVVAGEDQSGAPTGAPLVLYPRWVLVRLAAEGRRRRRRRGDPRLRHDRPRSRTSTRSTPPATHAMRCRSSAAGSRRRSASVSTRGPSFGRLAATWAVGVPAAVLVRALVLGRTLGGKEAAFLVVSLVTIGCS